MNLQEARQLALARGCTHYVRWDAVDEEEPFGPPLLTHTYYGSFNSEGVFEETHYHSSLVNDIHDFHPTPRLWHPDILRSFGEPQEITA